MFAHFPGFLWCTNSFPTMFLQFWLDHTPLPDRSNASVLHESLEGSPWQQMLTTPRSGSWRPTCLFSRTVRAPLWGATTWDEASTPLWPELRGSIGLCRPASLISMHHRPVDCSTAVRLLKEKAKVSLEDAINSEFQNLSAPAAWTH